MNLTATTAAANPTLLHVIGFLNAIGIPISMRSGATGFLSGVEIVKGRIEVDERAKVSDLLHEAGHLAVLPGRFRCTMSGDIDKGLKAMFSTLNREGVHPIDPVYVAAINGDDQAATAWAWAAGSHLSIPGESIIDGGYEGEFETVRTLLAIGAHAGISSLAASGFCSGRRGECPFPRLTFWIQP
jgi:hypothetical protein